MFRTALNVLLLALFAVCLCTCAPDFQSAEGTFKIHLKEEIRNVTYGYRKAYYRMEDTTYWNQMYAAADTVVPHRSGLPADQRKYRADGIWYEMKRARGEWRSWQQYKGFERHFDTVAHDVNLMVTNRHYAEVDIRAADIVLNGDSIRIAVIHELKPAYEFTFFEHEPQPDRLLLTTWGKDTMPIVNDMECVGVINQQTAFRVGKHHYVLRYVTPEYDGLVIEQLEDARGVPLTAELDLTYKPVPVNDLDGAPTTIKRTPGKELVIYFWGGFNGDKRAFAIDSLYRDLPSAVRVRTELYFVSRMRLPQDVKTLIAEHPDKLPPVLIGNQKTCLRLNCTGYLPYAVLVDGRGRIRSFSTSHQQLERYFEGQIRKGSADPD